MEYGSGVWGLRPAKNIDHIQNRAMRFFLGVHKFAPIPALFGDMGWHKNYLGRSLCTLRFWNRILTMDDYRLTKSIFNYDYNLCSKNWSFHIKCLLEEIGLIDNFINKTPVDLEVAKMALIDKFIFSWKEEVNNKPKLRTYIKFKKSAHVENYVLHCKDRYWRSMFAQFR